MKSALKQIINNLNIKKWYLLYINNEIIYDIKNKIYNHIWYSMDTMINPWFTITYYTPNNI